jgi:hypothetical protein
VEERENLRRRRKICCENCPREGAGYRARSRPGSARTVDAYHLFSELTERPQLPPNPGIVVDSIAGYIYIYYARNRE